MDLDSFFALKLLRERLKLDFDDFKLIFFSLVKKVCRHGKIRNFGLVAAF